MKTLTPQGVAGRRVLMVAPHPDDEAVGCGGYAHLLAKGGALVSVVVMARGDGGIDASEGAADPATRQAESVACCAALGTEPPHFLGLTSAAIRDDPAAAGAALARHVQPGSVDELLVPSPLERHDTHRACLLAALLSGVARPDATWWGWGAWDAIPAWDDVVEVDVTVARVAKTQAIRAHASQDGPRSLAAATLARDASQAAFSVITGKETRRAVERLMDLSAMVQAVGGAKDASSSALADAVGRWTADRSAQWSAGLWGAGGSLPS